MPSAGLLLRRHDTAVTVGDKGFIMDLTLPDPHSTGQYSLGHHFYGRASILDTATTGGYAKAVKRHTYAHPDHPAVAAHSCLLLR